VIVYTIGTIQIMFLKITSVYNIYVQCIKLYMIIIDYLHNMYFFERKKGVRV